jgi:hypothetical protein
MSACPRSVSTTKQATARSVAYTLTNRRYDALRTASPPPGPVLFQGPVYALYIGSAGLLKRSQRPCGTVRRAERRERAT